MAYNYKNFGIQDNPPVLMAFMDILCIVNSYNEVFTKVNIDERLDLKVKFLVLFDISTFNQIDAMLARLTELNYKPKKFDNIHLITINQKLFTFDIANNTFSIKHLYTHLERMAQIARNLYKGL